MVSRRSVLKGAIAAVGTAVFSTASTAANILDTIDPVPSRCLDIIVGQSGKRSLQTALNKIAENIHRVSQEERHRVPPIKHRVQKALIENRKLMSYYSLNLENIRALEYDQRQILLDELTDYETFEQAIAAEKQWLIDNNATSYPYIPMEEFVRSCRELKDIRRRPRTLDDNSGPSYLKIPVRIDQTGGIMPYPKDQWASIISKRTTS